MSNNLEIDRQFLCPTCGSRDTWISIMEGARPGGRKFTTMDVWCRDLCHRHGLYWFSPGDGLKIL